MSSEVSQDSTQNGSSVPSSLLHSCVGVSLSSSKYDKARRDLDSLFNAGQYYEALQLYKTLINRSNAKKDYQVAADLALDGAQILLRQKQGNAGGELALALLDAWKKAQLTPTIERIDIVLELFWLFPSDAATANKAFMKTALKWSREGNTTAATTTTATISTPEAQQQQPQHPRPSHSHPALHLSFARYCLISVKQTNDKDQQLDAYSQSHIHYLHAAGATVVHAVYGLRQVESAFKYPPASVSSLNHMKSAPATSSPSQSSQEYDSYCEHAAMVREWAELGFQSELDLFICRAVLQYLSLSDLKGANSFLDHVMSSLPSEQSAQLASTPLLHFLQFLLRCCERDAAPLFDVLRMKYQLALSRDPGLQTYIDKVGEIYFGKPVQKNILDSLFS